MLTAQEMSRTTEPLLAPEQRPRVPQGKRLLLCVGAQKAGTTWLAQMLGRGPSCHVQPIEKERHYFSTAYRNNTGMRGWRSKMILNLLTDIEACNDREYAQRVRHLQCQVDLMKILKGGRAGAHAWMTQLARSSGDKPYLCDFTPDYAFAAPGAFQEMAEYISPEGRRPKFIFIMRDPVDRYWSALRMFLLHNDVPEADAPQRLEEWIERDSKHSRMSAMRHCDYRYTVEQLDAHVPSQDVHFMFYETMFEQDTFDRLCRFLEIEPYPADVGSRVHEGRPFPFPHEKWAALRAGFDDIYTFAFDRFGDAIPEHWRRESNRPRPDLA